MNSTAEFNLWNLPPEIIEIITEYLSQKDKIQLMHTTLRLAEIMCSQLRQIEITYEEYLQCSGIKQPQNRPQPVSAQMIKHVLIDPCQLEYISKFKKMKVSDIQISGNESILIENDLLAPLALEKYYITEIDITALKVSLSTVSEIMQYCTGLKKFVLGETSSPCNNELRKLFLPWRSQKTTLKYLGIRNNQFFTGSIFQGAKTDTLMQLVLENCRYLSIEDVQLFTTENHTISHLELRNCTNSNSGSAIVNMLQNLGNTNIKSLLLSQTWHLLFDTWHVASYWTKVASVLSEFTIEGFGGLNPCNVRRIVRNAPNLNYLNTSGFNMGKQSFNHSNLNLVKLVTDNGLSDFQIDSFRTPIPTLKILDLRNAPIIHGGSLSVIVETNIKTLEVVDLRNVSYFRSAEAIVNLTYLTHPERNNNPIKIKINIDILKFYVHENFFESRVAQPAVVLVD